ncbi:hypothetical protein [Nonomuraea indica]|uniref:hypothetical protein n=1 Tax=Nonomuraea indica TaxID=1581193 RepID=UPI000C7B38C3|nr:hypothetical protein [Nonomuraea indica]
MRWRTVARIVVGTLLGADLLRIRPVLCVADCRPLTGGSPAWLAIGTVTLVVGLTVAGALRRRRSPR